MDDEVFQKPAASRYRVVRGTEGALDPQTIERHFDIRHFSPPDDLRTFVDRFWIIEWDFPVGESHSSPEVLIKPQVNAYFTSDSTGIQGVFTGKNNYKATGTGKIVGITFTPGGFYPFYGKSVSDLTGRTVPITTAFPSVDDTYTAGLLRATDTKRVEMLAVLLRNCAPEPDQNIEMIGELLSRIEQGVSINSVTEAAAQFGTSERTLQHLFRMYVGVGPKWILMRRRLLVAIERVRHESVEWSKLALDLGYNSKSHFIDDFRRIVGMAPGRYLEALRNGGDLLANGMIVPATGSQEVPWRR